MRPAAEVLEVRCVLSTITVTSLTDDTLANLVGDGQVSLREALEAANTNVSVDGSVAGDPAPAQDEIVFQAGLTGTILLTDGQLTISETVKITGLGADSTVLDAQFLSRVFDVTTTAGDVTLDGLTITFGATTGDDGGGGIRFLSSGLLTISNSTVTGNSTAGLSAHGGGVFSDSGAVTLTNSAVYFNSTTGDYAMGGGIYSRSGGVTLSNSTISSNSTAGRAADGGGVFSVYGGVTLTNSTVSGNFVGGDSASGGGIRSNSGAVILTNSTVSENSTFGIGAYGGGIYSESGAVTLTNSTVSGNSTAGESARGGGIYSYMGGVTLTNSTVSANSTAGRDARGGGIYSESGAVTLTNSTISGNSTAGENAGGGGIISRSGAVTLTNSTVSRNSTFGIGGYGGGIYSESGAVIATNSTLSGNSTAGLYGVGGGVSTLTGAVTLTNSTVTGNSTSGPVSPGGGVYSFVGDVTIHNSIVAGNASVTSHPDLRPGGTLTVQHSLIGDDSGTGLTEAPVGMPDANGNLIGDPSGVGVIDPRLGPLTFNGGVTMTHALLAGSPAIDAGSDALAVPLTSDQRGAPFVRTFDVAAVTDGVAGFTDMGAYELQTVAGLVLVVDTAVDEVDGDYAAGNLSLREAIGLANGSLGFDAITFAPSLSGVPVLLALGQFEITDSVSITGLGAGLTTIDAQTISRVLDVTTTAGDVTLNGLTLTGGSVFAEDGGGIRFLSSGLLTVSHSTISGNSAAHGGGISSTSGAVTLSNSTVSDNSSEYGGGGISSISGAVTLTKSTVSGNSTEGDGANGGGIASISGAVRLTNSTVSDNFTSEFTSARGGGVYTDSGAVTLTNSTVFNNSSGYGALGGGIFSEAGAVTIHNSIVAGNALFFESGNPDLRPGNDPAVLSVRHSLIGDNTGTGLTEAPVGAADANGSLIGDPSGGGVIDPRLGPLTFNGGTTKTHALLAGSPAIDAGSNALAETLGKDGLPGTDDTNEEPLTTDQRGMPFERIVDGPDANVIATVDMGAYERQTLAGLSLVVDSHVDEYDFDFSLGDLSLREAIGLANGSVGPDRITFSPALAGLPILLGLSHLEITDTVTITGLGAASTVIDAQNRSRVFDVIAAAPQGFPRFFGTPMVDVTLENLTITRPSTSPAELGVSASVRFFSTGRLTISNSIVSGNGQNRIGSGGGIFAFTGTVTLTNTTVTGNARYGIYGFAAVTLTNSTVSGNSRAGIATTGSVTLINSTVSGNGDTSTAGIGTGAVSLCDCAGGGLGEVSSHRGGVTGSVVTLTNSVVSDNSQGILGFLSVRLTNSIVSGNTQFGIHMDGGDVTLTNSTVSGNGGSGGNVSAGIRTSFGGAVTLTNSTVSGNCGGGIRTIYGAVTLTNSTISGNSVPSVRYANNAYGGGIFSRYGAVTLTDSTISGNSTARDSAAGGGIASLHGPVTLTNSIVSGNSTAGNDAGGGGIYTLSGAVTLTNSTVSGNSTAGDGRYDSSGRSVISGGGGGIFSVHGAVTLVSSTVSGNSTAGNIGLGGGIYSRTGAVTLTDSTVSGNSTAGDDSSGGGISTSHGAVTLTNSTVSDNSTAAKGAGGGIHTLSGAVTLTNGTVSGNSTAGPGGGISTGNGAVTLTNSTVSENSTAGEFAVGGGIFSFKLAEVTLTNSTVSGNSTTGDNSGGGGIFLGNPNEITTPAGGSVTLTNSTVSGNSTTGGNSDGGGIFSRSVSVTLTNSIVSGNSAEGLRGEGGGIFSDAAAVTIWNSIVAGNSAMSGSPDLRPGVPRFTIPVPPTVLSVRHSLIGDNSATGLTAAPVGMPDGNGNLIGQPVGSGGLGIIDPLLGPLADNGGPTLTHRLLPGSPAIDAGDDLLAVDPTTMTALTTDQRGVTRIIDGDGDMTATVDMGAYELALPFDFGDAPDPRSGMPVDAGKSPTRDANGGAKHRLGSGLSLGPTVDGDADGQPNATATGDDADADGDDEDGVALPATLIAGLNAVADVTASADGLLDAWIDFDSDGEFDADEQIATSLLVTAAGRNAVTFLIPATAADGTTFARFRLSSAGGLSPGGEADDGEVEDYAVVIDVLASGWQIVADPLSPSAAADLLVCVGTAGKDKIEFLKGSAAGMDTIKGESGTDKAVGGQGGSGPPRNGNDQKDVGDRITAELIDESFAILFAFE